MKIFISLFLFLTFSLNSWGQPTSKTPTTAPASPKVPKKVAQILASIELAEDKLKAILWRYGRDPENPWLLGHLLLAFGGDIRLPDGTSAVDKILQYARVKKVNGLEIPYFPVGTQFQRIEPHPYFQLKTLLEIGVPLSKKFSVDGKTFTVGDILRGALLTFPVNAPQERLGDYVWLLFTLYGHLPKERWHWKTATGQSVFWPRIIHRYVKFLDHQTSFLFVMKSKGVKKIPKLRIRKQYIYGEPCGGLHLVQGVMRWLTVPTFNKAYSSIIGPQIELLFYRYDGEMALYDELFKKYRDNEAYRFIILLQQLKFLGHYLETIANLYRWGLFTPTTRLAKKLRDAVQRGILVFLILQKLGWYDRVPALKKHSFQFYLDLMGDTSHLLHSLRLFRENPLLLVGKK